MKKLSDKISVLFFAGLVLTSCLAVSDPAYAQESFAESTHADYRLSWTPDFQNAFAEDNAFLELVIGISSKPNSFVGLSQLVTQSGGKIANVVSMGAKQAVIVDVPVNSVSSFSAKARVEGFAGYIEPNRKFTVNSIPNDQYWRLQWGLQNIQADYAWNTTAGSKTVLVAVVDTGVDYMHPDLAANYVALGRNWVGNNNNPLDDNGHGTHCAGIIAASINNSIGVAGLAQVRIMAEKALAADGSGYADDLANAIIHATNQGAKIISNSWGSSDSSMLIHDAIIYARDHGVLVFAAAGNEGNNEPQYPGAYDEVICVSATNRTGTPASFTTYGNWVDVAAPGVSIASTYPNASYVYMSGTSMATPTAVGVAALIWSRFPNMTAALVRYQLESTADDLGSPGFDVYYGNGKVNAKKAVEQVPVEDVLVSDWNTPNQFLKVNHPEVFNATIFNRGLTPKIGVQVKLLANSSLVNSTIIPALSSGAKVYTALTWTPAAQGSYNLTVYLVPQLGESLTQNNVATKNFVVGTPPSDANWTLITNDPDEGEGLNIKAVYSQQLADVVYFKVQFYHQWSNISTDINAAILVDSDRNARTGLPDHYYIDQNTDLGADYIILVGADGFEIWRWNSTLYFFDMSNPIALSYLDAPDNASEFIVGVKMSDIVANGVFDFAVADVYSNWDWAPNRGHRPFIPFNVNHELAVTLFNAEGTEPGQSLVLNATVYNFGVNSEANLSVYLLINGTVVKSVQVSQLANGSCYSTVYSWTPLVEAIYNITAYAQPLIGENISANNVKSMLVPVSYKIALISDNYELDYILALLDSMWINHDSHYYNYFYLHTENLTLLKNYPTVIFYKTERNITDAEQSALNAYLAWGGNLLVTGYDSLGSPDDTRLANVVRSASVGNDLDEPDLYVVNASHPIMHGPYGTFPEGYHISGLWDDNDAAEADASRGAVTVAELADGKDKVIATESLPGKVVYWNGDGVGDWVENANCTTMLKNMLVWLVDVAPPVSTVDYNGGWYTADFTINITASDYFGVNQSCYKINGGPIKTVSVDGQPKIATEGADITLEYWSIDVAGNQEPPCLLTGIKLDKTNPVGSLQINSGKVYTNSVAVTLTLNESDVTSGVHQVRYSDDNIWDTTTWETPTLNKAWTLKTGDGNKTVYCQISDNAGLQTIVYATIILDTTPPTANAGQSQTITQGGSVVLNGAGSADANGIVSYLWDFGDAVRAFAATVTHSYIYAGTYTAKLTVQDAAGNEATATVTILVKPRPAPTPTPTPTTAPAPTTHPTSTPAPSPSSAYTVIASLNDGGTLNLALVGNITAGQITNAKIQTDQSNSSTIITFTLAGQEGNAGFVNLTVPKSQVANGVPIVIVDDLKIVDQGYTQDAVNFYVWYMLHFSAKEVEIVFNGYSAPATDLSFWVIIAISVLLVCALMVGILLRKHCD